MKKPRPHTWEPFGRNHPLSAPMQHQTLTIGVECTHMIWFGSTSGSQAMQRHKEAHIVEETEEAGYASGRGWPGLDSLVGLYRDQVINL